MVIDLKGQIIEYIEKCRVCTIATVGANGQPCTSTVFFKNRGVDIYFNTSTNSEKVKNISMSPHVAIAMQEDGPTPKEDRDIRGIQYVGKAMILSDRDTDGVPEAVIARHHAFNSVVRAGSSAIIRVTPAKIYLIDYSRGFRHRDFLEF